MKTYEQLKYEMSNGILYDDNVKELVKEREIARKTLFKYNKTSSSNQKKRVKLIKNILGKIEEPFFIATPFNFSYGTHIEIGKNFYANFNLVIIDDAKVIIGDNVLVAPNVVISTAGHPENIKNRTSALQYSKTIVIEDNVWIGANVTINPGVTIGKNSIIGSGSVVTKDIPSDVVAYGVPCRVIRAIDSSK